MPAASSSAPGARASLKPSSAPRPSSTSSNLLVYPVVLGAGKRASFGSAAGAPPPSEEALSSSKNDQPRGS